MNIFILSCIITAALTAIMCLIMLFSNIRDKINRSWFFVCMSTFIWAVGLYGTVAVGDKESALFWQRILYIGTILAPILFFYFSLILLKRNQNKKALFFGFFLSVVFIFLSFSRFFVVGVKDRTDFDYWPVQTGSLYFIFLAYFMFYLVYSLVLLKIDSKKYDGVYQKQIQFVYYAGLVGFIGASTNFLLDFNLNTYAIGNYFMIFYTVFISYAVFKHHLFNIKVIATELFSLALWITLFTKIFVSESAKDLALNICILLASVVIGVLLIRSVIKEVEQREKIEKIEKELEKAYGVEKRANEELKNLDKYKNDFLRQTQHDLKNPLTVIMGYSDLLISGTFGKISKKGIDVLKRMEVVAQEKVKDVNNFLDTEQFKMGKKVVSLGSDVQLSSILKEIKDRLLYQAELKGLYLRLEMPEKIFPVLGDREKLKAAIFNVVDNSIKYTQNGGVDIKVESDGVVKVIISDTGIGIPKDKLNTIFEKQFERTKEAQKTAAGSGVGLYLSSQIIKLHNGKIWAESEGEGKGSTFYIELPVEHDAHA